MVLVTKDRLVLWWFLVSVEVLIQLGRHLEQGCLRCRLLRLGFVLARRARDESAVKNDGASKFEARLALAVFLEFKVGTQLEAVTASLH